MVGKKILILDAPSARAASITRSRVCCDSLMPGELLSTKETVACEQPAALAMSVMVTRPPLAVLADALRRRAVSSGSLVSLMAFVSPIHRLSSGSLSGRQDGLAPSTNRRRRK